MTSLGKHALTPILVVSLLGCRGSAPSSPEVADATQSGTVTVQIHTGSQFETIRIDDVQPGTTVESLMRSIDQIAVSIQGSGVTAFVDGLGDTSTSSHQGWKYQVDGEFANQGIGSTALTPPTTITWTYGDASEMADPSP